MYARHVFVLHSTSMGAAGAPDAGRTTKVMSVCRSRPDSLHRQRATWTPGRASLGTSHRVATGHQHGVAQDSNEATPPPPVDTERITVYATRLNSLEAPTETGSRLGVPLSDIPASVFNIDQLTIRTRGFRTAQEAVESVVGFTGANSPGNGADHTELYVSARTGEVVRDTTRSERILSFFGCVVHWIYPSSLRRHTGAWRLTIQILSGAAFLVPLSGVVIGLPRLRTAWRQMHGARRWHILLGGVFGIPAQTWFHIDPASGKLTERLTRRSRTYRWLFNGLHSFDWPWLAQRRPLWDAVVLLTLGGGLSLCLLGLRLAWRRISPRMASGPGTEQPQP